MVGIKIDQALTDDLIERAISECADVYFHGDIRQVDQAMRRGEWQYCQYVIEHLAKEISEYLGQVDKSVKAIYHFQPAEPMKDGDSVNAPIPIKPPSINLIAWVERKSAALNALLDTFASVLSGSLRKTGCFEVLPGSLALHIHLVDDQEVQTQRGLGLLIQNSVIISEPAWQRSDIPDLRPSVAVPIPSRISFSTPESFDPELIPESRLIDHAFAIERIPPEDRAVMEPHLTELKVILIRRMISEHLSYINIAKRWFSVSDLSNIYQHRIGYGRIGGKSAGMLLAARILQEVGDEEIKTVLKTPESYFIGSELIYIFMSMNGLVYWNDQKYKPEEQIREEYPIIQEEFQSGSFPPEILEDLKRLLAAVGNQPLIVRSSSQLEDNFGTSFAGKYDSYFCPNQGSPEENLAALTNAITRTYASTLKPEALLYRRSKGLQDYDEKMAVLIQVVQGERFGNYFLPQGSGVAFSRNIYRWSPEIKPEAGFARLVWGLGTRAVQRIGDDYPRLVALSHPTLQPDDSTDAIRYYSQRNVDLIDLDTNTFVTKPIEDVLLPGYPPLNLIAQIERDGFFVTPRSLIPPDQIPDLAINFQEFLNRTEFAEILSRVLRILEKHYHSALDIEFTINIPNPRQTKPAVELSLLQCRPQSYLEEIRPPRVPKDIAEEDILFSTTFMVPRGYLDNIHYVLYIKPEVYFSLESSAARNQVSQTISRLNSVLEEKSFICIGPGRWGSTNIDLGVYVSYFDIHNAAALVELSGRLVGTGPEPSLGTHFFQDLMEAHIYPLAVPLDNEDTYFNTMFFEQTQNDLKNILEVDEVIENCIHVVHIDAYRPGTHIALIMNDEQSQAMAFLTKRERIEF